MTISSSVFLYLSGRLAFSLVGQPDDHLGDRVGIEADGAEVGVLPDAVEAANGQVARRPLAVRLEALPGHVSVALALELGILLNHCAQRGVGDVRMYVCM